MAGVSSGPIIRKRTLITIGVITLVIGIIANLPARHLFGWLQNNGQLPPSLQTSGLQGTVWNGHAQRAQLNGLGLYELEWQAKPLGLLVLNPGWNVGAQTNNGYLETVVYARGQNLKLKDLRANLPLRDLPLPPLVPLDGELFLDISELHLENRLPTKLVGETTLNNAALVGSSPLPLGTLLIDWIDVDAGLSGTINDLDGVVEVAGTVTVDSDGNYELNARLTPRASTSEEIVNALNLFARKQTDGSWEILYRGSLDSFLPR